MFVKRMNEREGKMVQLRRSHWYRGNGQDFFQHRSEASAPLPPTAELHSGRRGVSRHWRLVSIAANSCDLCRVGFISNSEAVPRV